MTLARVKPWLKRWIGLTINATIFLALTAGDIANALEAQNVDWSDIFGDEKGKVVTQGITLANIILRVFVTRTKGSPDA